MKGLLACLALVLLGCGEADKPKPKNQPKQGTPGAPGAVARPPVPVSPKDKLQAEVIEMLRKEAILIKQKLAVLEQPGVWKHVNVSRQAQSSAERKSTDEAHTYWLLGGKCLVTEIHELEPDAETYQLMLRTYDARNEKYRMFFYMRPGHGQVFSGKWDAAAKAMTWTLDFESPNTRGGVAEVVIVEKIKLPSRKVMDFTVTAQGKQMASGSSECTLDKDGKAPAPPKGPAEKLGMLGDGGEWLETQTLEETGGKPETVKTVSQFRWVAGGNFLLIDGKTEVAGYTEHSLGVKSFDASTQTYGYATIWDAGYVDFYRGKWDPGAEKMTWNSELLSSFPEGVSVGIHETLPSDKQRHWMFEVIQGRKLLLLGHGQGKHSGK